MQRGEKEIPAPSPHCHSLTTTTSASCEAQPTVACSLKTEPLMNGPEGNLQTAGVSRRISSVIYTRALQASPHLGCRVKGEARSLRGADMIYTPAPSGGVFRGLRVSARVTVREGVRRDAGLRDGKQTQASDKHAHPPSSRSSRVCVCVCALRCVCGRLCGPVIQGTSGEVSLLLGFGFLSVSRRPFFSFFRFPL